MVTASIYLPNGKMDFVCNQMYHNQQSSDDRQVCQRMRQMTSTRVSGNITYMLDFPRQPASVRVAASDIMNGRQPTIRCSKGEHYNNECCVEECKDRLCVPWGLYCLYHRDPKTRCLKCLVRGRPDGSTRCSGCNLLCRKSGCENQLPDGSEIKLCSTCNLLCRTNNCMNQLAEGSATLCSTCNTCARYDCNEQVIIGKQILCVCVCVCELYYRQFYYFYSPIIVLFYSLGSRYCTTGVQGFKECCVENCTEPRYSPKYDCLYCLYHRDQKETKTKKLKRDQERRSIMSKEGTITDPNKNDVLCGRGKGINNHPGNVQFRSIIQSK